MPVGHVSKFCINPSAWRLPILIMNFKEIEATQARKFSFGKHSGRTVEDVYLRDTSYLEWMIAPSTNFNNKELVRKVKQYLEWKNAKPEPEKGS